MRNDPLKMKVEVLVVCVALHVVLFFSIFDIYFRSPIDPNLVSVPSTNGVDSPARRVVLIVADGLRADTCFRFLGRDDRYHHRMNNEPRENYFQADAVVWPLNKQSFLRKVIEESGLWGVSHTRVPTESRPGHVAMIAGFYEDVSAVTKGWQDNPVEFDHVFKQSARTFAFGSADITRMFAKPHHHVVDEFYSQYDEDFASKDLSGLDTWVFNKVAKLLQDSKTNETLSKLIHQKKVFFFLHLLGLDSNGHAHRPHSSEYTLNMATVDKLVEGVYHMFEEYFSDGLTGYVFSSDHGMGDKGSHGDGDPTNTRTPFIAWGAGTKKPDGSKGTFLNGINTGYSLEEEQKETYHWGLDHLARQDIEQADIAPLLSTLLGIPIPVHSVGRLPVNYLQKNEYTALALLANVKQLLRQVRHKEFSRANRQIYFKPFTELAEADAKIKNIQSLIDHEKNFKQAQVECDLLLKICQRGLHYYQVYDRPYLMSLVVLGYVGWIALLLLEIVGKLKLTIPTSPPAICTGIAFACAEGYQLFERAPMMYSLYLAFPAVFWVVLVDHYPIHVAFSLSSLFYIGCVDMLVFGYSYREIYFALFVILALWPNFVLPKQMDTYSLKLLNTVQNVDQLLFRVMWGSVCILLGSFTLIPLNVNDSPILLALGYVCVVAVVFGLRYFNSTNKGWIVQLALLTIASFLSQSTDRHLRSKSGLPIFNQLLTLVVFVSAPLFPVLLPRYSGEKPMQRYTSVFLALATPYSLLSINFEILFFGVLGVGLTLWMMLEKILGKGATLADDIRSAFLFLLFVNIAFFGTGNIASMSSFQISSTYRFITVFSPFIMGALLIIKLLIPYTLVTVVASFVASDRQVNRIFMLVLAMCDLMALHLFFFVQDYGSLQIGNSISQFGFINCQLFFIPLLFVFASFFVSDIAVLKSKRS